MTTLLWFWLKVRPCSSTESHTEKAEGATQNFPPRGQPRRGGREHLCVDFQMWHLVADKPWSFFPFFSFIKHLSGAGLQCIRLRVCLSHVRSLLGCELHESRLGFQITHRLTQERSLNGC